MPAAGAITQAHRSYRIARVSHLVRGRPQQMACQHDQEFSAPLSVSGLGEFLVEGHSALASMVTKSLGESTAMTEVTSTLSISFGFKQVKMKIGETQSSAPLPFKSVCWYQRGARQKVTRMTTWRIRYEDQNRSMCECYGQQESTPSCHEALELVVEHLIQVARHVHDAAHYSQLLSTSAISAIEIVGIAAVNPPCLHENLLLPIAGPYARL